MPFIAEAIIGITALVGSISSFVAATGFIGQAVIGAGLSVATGYLIQALGPKANNAGIQGGTQLDHKYGTNLPRQVAIGRVGLAGHDVYMSTIPAVDNNRDYVQTFALSDFYATRLRRMAIDGHWITLVGDPSAGFTEIVDYPWQGGLVTVKFHDGKQTTADAFLVFAANPTGKWDTNCIGTGVAYVSCYVSYEKDRNDTFPDFFFEIEGAPLYDWRKDDTVGGVGDHRWDDQDTWEFTENPIVAAYNYRRGFSINGDLFCGMGMAASDLPLDKWTAAANICDEIVGDGERYRVSAMLSSMATHGDNLKTLSLACGALDVDDLDGAWPIVGSEQVSVDTFTDDDIISTANNFKFTRHVSMSDLVNSVAGNYSEPEEVWSPVGYDEQTDSAIVTLDRRTRDVAIDFPQVPYKAQCEQLASIFFLENRYEATATVTLRPRFQVLQVGDWVDWESERYGNMTFMVVAKGLLSLDSEGPRNAVLTLKQRDGAIYDGIISTEYIPAVPLGEPTYSTEVDDFTAIAVPVTGSDGRVIPGIRVSWSTVTDVTVTSVEVIYYPTDQPDAINTKIVDVNRTVLVLTDVVSNTEYTIKAKIITRPSRVTAYNAGVTVTTENLTGIGIANVDEALRYQMTTLLDNMRDDLDVITQQIAGIAATMDARNWIDKKTIRTQMSAQFEDAFASIEEVRTVAVDTQTAFASFETTATASFGSTTAFVTTSAAAIATYDGWGAAEYSVTLNVDGYATGFNLINGGAGTSEFVVVADKFQIQLPSYNSDAPYSVFTTGLVGGVASVGINGNLLIDGTLIARMIGANEINTVHLNATSVTAAKMAAASITAANGAIDALAVKSLNIQGNAVTVPGVQTFSSSAVSGTIASVTLNIDTAGLSGQTIMVYANCSISASGGGLGANYVLKMNGSTVLTSQAIGSGAQNTPLSWAIAVTGTGGTVSVPVTVEVVSIGAITSSGALYVQAAKR